MALGVFPTRNKAKRNVSLPTLLFHVIRCVSLFEFLCGLRGQVRNIVILEKVDKLPP